MRKTNLAPKLRFPSFFGQWQLQSIGNVTEIKTGDKDTKNKIHDGVYPFFVRSDQIEKINTYSYEGESVLTSGDGAGVGKIFHYINGKFDFHQRVYSIRNFSKELNGKYFYYFFSKKFPKRVYGLSAKNSVDSVRMDMISEMPISLPSLPEQQKIADFLTTIDTRLRQLREKAELLRTYKKGVMQQLFSQQIRFRAEDGGEFGEWEEKRLGEVAKIYDGTHQTPEYVEKGIPFYSVEHLTRNDFSKTKYISEHVYEKECKRVKLEKGDILMTRIGDIGTSIQISWDVKASFYVSLALIKQSIYFNSKYLNQFIKSVDFQKELHKRTIHVAFPKKINLGEIGLCIAKFPSLPEQQKIADFLTALDERIQTVEAQIEQTEVFKRGLLQQMFV